MRATIKHLRRLERTCPQCSGAMQLCCPKCGREPITLHVVYEDKDIAEKADEARRQFQEFLRA